MIDLAGYKLTFDDEFNNLECIRKAVKTLYGRTSVQTGV